MNTLDTFRFLVHNVGPDGVMNSIKDLPLAVRVYVAELCSGFAELATGNPGVHELVMKNLVPEIGGASEDLMDSLLQDGGHWLRANASSVEVAL